MSNLILNRRPRESFTIETSDGPITVTYQGKRPAHIAIDAPRKCRVLRTELVDVVKDANAGCGEAS